jgi:general secretion pathway protein C
MNKVALTLLLIFSHLAAMSIGILIDQKYIPKVLSSSPTSSALEKAKELGVQPNIGSDGSVMGFKIMNVPPGSIYEKLGFKSGDIITTVNGVKLDSVQAAMGLYTELKHATKAEVGVLRGTETLTITVHQKDFKQ